MVDIAARHTAYEALRKFAAGLTTNDEFESEFPSPSKTPDRAIKAVETMVWNFYSDLEVHTLTGSHTPDAKGQKLLERTLCFLRCDLEYQWPKDDFLGIGKSPFLDWVTLGVYGRWYDRQHRARMIELERFGDFDAWPFMSHSEVEQMCGELDRSIAPS